VFEDGVVSVAAELPAGDVLQQLRAKTGPGRAQHLIPVADPLVRLLPEGGLRPGCAYSVAGGALLLALLAEPSAAGSWCGVVGVPELGAEAARNAGVALDRLALVPQPGERWLSVVAALAEVLPVVAVRPASRVRDADAARLAARLRERSTVLLVCGDWPRVEASFGLRSARWEGLGEGNGYLTGREVEVAVTTRHTPVPRATRLLLPDRSGRLSRAVPAAATELRAVG
jgi:hypothetical protein